MCRWVNDKALKSELGQESKEGVPCKVNWKSDLVIENKGNDWKQLVGSTQNISENLQGYSIEYGKLLFSLLQ